MSESESIEIDSGGVVGENRKGKKRQVTLLAQEGWEAAQAGVGAELHWTTRRANLFVAGLELANTTCRRIRVGSALLEITAETEPCALMDQFHQGLRKALEPDWRGGASARVVEPGQVKIGDGAQFED